VPSIFSLAVSPNLSRATKILLTWTIAVGLMHHIDHVMRADHSGWPFLSQVTPFTYSLLAYPMLLFVLLAKQTSLWPRFAAVAALTAFTLFAHIEIETPYMQYAMWTLNRSVDPHVKHVQNIFSVQSPGLGIIAVAIGMTLNALLVLSSASLFADAYRRSQ